jgi:2-polyprenyl-3-methyl-5-hydroxy-6-metoxy-1,4-benzoquinol methylase
MDSLQKETIQTIPVPECSLCGGPGEYLYRKLQERFLGTSAGWNFKRCPSCGLVWLDPIPTQAYLDEIYKKFYGEKDTPEGAHDNLTGLRQKVQSLALDGYIALRTGRSSGLPIWSKLLGLFLKLRDSLEWSYSGIQARNGRKLLDLGCGSGELLDMLRSLGWEVEGVDTDPVAVQNALAKKLRVYLGSLADRQYPAAYFDVIIMNHVIEHLQDPIPLLSECYRILKPQGRLIIVTPNLESWGQRIFKQSWVGLAIPAHFYLYSSHSLQVIVEKAGFKAASLITTAKSALWFFHASRTLLLNKRNVLNPKPSLIQQFMALGFVSLEWLMINLHYNLGEELALEAVKCPHGTATKSAA